MTVSMKWSLACLALYPEGLYAPSIAGSEDNAVNMGQDFTRPLGQVDLRWTYRDLSEYKESHSITLRTEQPWKLSDRWNRTLSLCRMINLERFLTAPIFDTVSNEAFRQYNTQEIAHEGLYFNTITHRR